MNTTSTAQYAAEAAKSSCLVALVKLDMAMPKSKVKTISIPIASNGDARWLTLESWYIATTGKISRTKITAVMMTFTSLSIRSGA